jgi:hypothetical protein
MVADGARRRPDEAATPRAAADGSNSSYCAATADNNIRGPPNAGAEAVDIHAPVGAATEPAALRPPADDADWSVARSRRRRGGRRGHRSPNRYVSPHRVARTTMSDRGASGPSSRSVCANGSRDEHRESVYERVSARVNEGGAYPRSAGGPRSEESRVRMRQGGANPRSAGGRRSERAEQDGDCLRSAGPRQNMSDLRTAGRSDRGNGRSAGSVRVSCVNGSGDPGEGRDSRFRGGDPGRRGVGRPASGLHTLPSGDAPETERAALSELAETASNGEELEAAATAFAEFLHRKIAGLAGSAVRSGGWVQRG